MFSISSIKLDNLLALSIYDAIKEKSIPKLSQIFREATHDSLYTALTTHHPQLNQLTPLGYAAQEEFSEGVYFIAGSVSAVTLEFLLTRLDSKNWTPLHHIAIIDDNGVCYKKIKKLSRVNSKTITEHYCESPSFMRQCLKDKPRRFTRSIYVRTGNLGERKEELLTFEEVKKKYNSIFTEPPSYFQSIPHCTIKYFRDIYKHFFVYTRNERKLNAIDDHLKNIYIERGEHQLALATVTYDDEQKPLDEEVTQKIGFGVETRDKFKKNQSITLCGGEKYCGKRISSIYAFSVDDNLIFSDGKERRSFGSMMLHSFPNTRWTTTKTILGPLLSVSANEDIPKDSLLTGFYGTNHFSLIGSTPSELCPKAKREYEYKLKKEIHADTRIKKKPEKLRRIYIKNHSKDSEVLALLVI